MVIHSCLANQEPDWLIDSTLDADYNSKVPASAKGDAAKRRKEAVAVGVEEAGEWNPCRNGSIIDSAYQPII